MRTTSSGIPLPTLESHAHANFNPPTTRGGCWLIWERPLSQTINNHHHSRSPTQIETIGPHLMQPPHLTQPSTSTLIYQQQDMTQSLPPTKKASRNQSTLALPNPEGGQFNLGRIRQATTSRSTSPTNRDHRQDQIPSLLPCLQHQQIPLNQDHLNPLRT